jgi:hypothetical protein
MFARRRSQPALLTLSAAFRASLEGESRRVVASELCRPCGPGLRIRSRAAGHSPFHSPHLDCLDIPSSAEPAIERPSTLRNRCIGFPFNARGTMFPETLVSLHRTRYGEIFRLSAGWAQRPHAKGPKNRPFLWCCCGLLISPRVASRASPDVCCFRSIA